MCGIFGVVSDRLPPISEIELSICTDSLAHRGPDDRGLYLDSNVGLGHRRLSIIDLSSGQQPIFNEKGDTCIIFNGEIYNYLELRNKLINKGHTFRTNSDTETILHAYEEWGDESVVKLKGMFAYAIWNRTKKELFVARDRFGIKPLHYSVYGSKLYFASEIKAILAANPFPLRIDYSALAAYFLLSYIPAPLTIYPEIRKLPAGYFLKWSGGDFSIKQYWDISSDTNQIWDQANYLNNFDSLFGNAISSHLMSEVPLGAFLSGGIDSSAVVAYMARYSKQPVKTFCVGFSGNVGGYLDERKYAKNLSDSLNTDHHEILVKPEFGNILDLVNHSFDEPFADDSALPSYFVCKAARKIVTVALSGLGGDEGFLGYERYLGFALHSIYNRFPQAIKRFAFEKLINRLPERADGHYTINHLKRFVRSSHSNPADTYLGFISRISPKYFNNFFIDDRFYKKYLPEVKSLLRDYFNSNNLSSPSDSLERAIYCDLKTYLPEDILAVTDRMSMQNSLEVRVPFLDNDFFSFALSIPKKMHIEFFQKKFLLKKALRTVLPAEILNHRKQGFVGPMSQWLKNELRSQLQEECKSLVQTNQQIINPNTISTILNDHFANREINDTLLWSLAIFQRWVKRTF